MRVISSGYPVKGWLRQRGGTLPPACPAGSSENFRPNGYPPVHPNGTLIKLASDQTFYLIRDGQKQGIISQEVLEYLYNNGGFRFEDVINVSQEEFNSYPTIGEAITSELPSNNRGKADGTLIRKSSNGQISIVTDNGNRRPFNTYQTYTNLGYKDCNFIDVADDEYNSYPAENSVDAMPKLTASMRLYNFGNVGQQIRGEFTITNVGTSAFTFNKLGIGGRLNNSVIADFPFVSSVTLSPGQSYNYSQFFTPNSPGSYRFFVTYEEPNGHWATSVPVYNGAINSEIITINNSPATCPSPTAIFAGQNVSGTLQNRGCLINGKYYDAYTFNGTSGQQIYTTLSAQFDTYLYLYQGNYSGGTLLTQDDDGGGGTNSRIPATSGFLTLPAAGTYTILASSYSANATGSYTLFLGTGGQSCAYSINPASQSFSAQSGNGTIAVTTNPGCNWISTSNNSWITTTSGSSGSGNGTVGYSVAQNTTTTQRQGTITIAGQTLTITQSGTTTSCPSPSVITFGQTVSGTLQNRGCLINGKYYDAYTFNVTTQAQRSISIRLNSTQVDSYLYLYRENYPGGSLWSINDDGGGYPNARIPASSGYLTLPATGTYTILASSYASGQSGSYTLFLGSPLINIDPKKTLYDFDSDGKTDYSVFRPSDGVWYFQSSTNGFDSIQFGNSSDKIVAADYDGDGRTDMAVYRNGTWYLQRSSDGFTGIQFGLSSDIPAPADYDGDGKAELGVYRPSNGTWYALNLTNNNFNAVQFGISTDKPVAADYDGDGKVDYAVYRPETGVWYILRSRDGFASVQFGISTDKPVVGDYDGDGIADEAVYRPTSGVWYLLKSSQGFASVQFGISTDLPVSGDYDGDGKSDIAVWRPSSGVFYVLQSNGNQLTATQFGASGDLPIASALFP